MTDEPLISDHERRAKWPIRAVHVACNNDGDEYYEVGKHAVTAIEWGHTDGHMAHLATVVVFMDGQPHSEHPFSNVLGVYYARPPKRDETDTTK